MPYQFSLQAKAFGPSILPGKLGQMGDVGGRTADLLTLGLVQGSACNVLLFLVLISTRILICPRLDCKLASNALLLFYTLL